MSRSIHEIGLLNKKPDFIYQNAEKNPFVAALAVETIAQLLVELRQKIYQSLPREIDHESDSTLQSLLRDSKTKIFELYRTNLASYGITFTKIDWPEIKIVEAESIFGLEHYHHPALELIVLRFVEVLKKDIHGELQLMNFQALHHELHQSISRVNCEISGFSSEKPAVLYKNYGFVSENESGEITGELLNEAMVEYYANLFVTEEDSIYLLDARLKFASMITRLLAQIGEIDFIRLAEKFMLNDDKNGKYQYDRIISQKGLEFFSARKYTLAAFFFKKLIAKLGETTSRLFFGARLNLLYPDSEKYGKNKTFRDILKLEIDKKLGSGAYNLIMCTKFELEDINKLIVKLGLE